MFIIALTIQSGVFTVVVYMGITLFSFFFLGKKYALWKKIVVFVVGVFLLFITQNVKTSFRDVTWKGKEVDNKTSLFVDLIVDKLTNFDKMVDLDGFFPVYMRTNQGYNISVVMSRIPAQQDFDDGNRLMTTAIGTGSPVTLARQTQSRRRRKYEIFYGYNMKAGQPM